MKHQYSYSLNDHNELMVYEDNCVMATISDVQASNAETVFKDIVFELRDIDLDEEVAQ